MLESDCLGHIFKQHKIKTIEHDEETVSNGTFLETL